MAISYGEKQLNYDELLARFNELSINFNSFKKESETRFNSYKKTIDSYEKEIKAKDTLLELSAIREANLNKELEALKEKFTLVRVYTYGKKSEKTKAIKEMLVFNDLIKVSCNLKPENSTDLKTTPVDKGVIKVTKSPYEKKYAKIPKEIIYKDVEEKKCPECGSDIEPIGVSSKTHLEYQPGFFYLVEEISTVYKCKNKECEAIVGPEPNKSSLSSLLLTGNSIAHIMTENIIKDVPLYRQEQYLKSMGVNISRMTMSNSFAKACDMLLPLYDSIWNYAKQESLLHIDETPFNVLHTIKDKQEKKGYMWIYANKYNSENPFVYYAFSPDRGAYNVENRLKESTLTIMTDGYHGYNHVGPNITRACCMAHARRKFCDVLKLNPQHDKSKLFVKYFNKLYEVEDKIKDLSNEEILKERQKTSKLIFDNILNLLESELGITAPKSKYYEALNYLNNFKKELQIYLNDGNVPIDNNQAERMAKYFVMYRKNSLFANTEEGANRTAMLHTIIQSARINGLSIEKYLALLFTEFEQITTNEIPKYYPWSDYVKEKCLIANEKMAD